MRSPLALPPALVALLCSGTAQAYTTYQMLVASRVNESAGREFFLFDYASEADPIAGTVDYRATQINLNSNHKAVGFLSHETG
ncbi:hypothetical protein [Rhodovulum kholense]|uniref:Uncharacterized protein n=1 Tax=Rhodovulum kholense TaxID=453584 RepID=A0A8E2VK90_9RHOB|nr:hypothetical protein [Rhodovulum kholense]PTW48381.1 hypothetical protein C8N38_108134 [Rhodovulum kholense]